MFDTIVTNVKYWVMDFVDMMLNDWDKVIPVFLFGWAVGAWIC